MRPSFTPLDPARIASDIATLSAVAHVCDRTVDPNHAREAVKTTAQLGDSALLLRLSLSLRTVGVRLSVMSWSFEEAMAQLRPGVCLVVADHLNPEIAYLIHHRDGRTLHLANGQTITTDELIQRIGADRDQPIDWGLARPSSPVEGMVGRELQTHGGHTAHGAHGAGGHHGTTPIRRLWGLIKPESGDLWVVGIFSLMIGLLSLATPITVEAIVGSVQGGNSAMMQVVTVLTLVLLFCLALAGAMRALKIYVVELIQRRIFVRVVADLSYRLPRVCTEAFDEEHGPELVNRFFDVLTVQKASATLMLDGLAVIIQAIVALLVLAIWHPFLLGFNLVLMVGFVVLIWVLGYGGITAKIRESYAKYAVAGWLEEMVRNPLAFKHTSGQEYAMNRADDMAREYILARRDSFAILYRQILFGIGLQAMASAALLGLGGYLVIRNELTLGQLVAAELIVAVTVGSFVKLGKSLESWYDLMAAVDKLGHLVDLPLERQQGEYLPIHPMKADGRPNPVAIEIRDLSFTYHGATHRGFGGVNAMIPAGARAAIVGPSGTGKSTLLELLFGLREPAKGLITVDGIDMRDIRLETIREQTATVSHKEVFDGDIIDNVRLGRPGITLNDVRDALDAVGLLEDIQNFPHGMRTHLSTGGAPLSWGQQQRLMLARALAGKPRLLLVDGVLDRLDPNVRANLIPVLFDKHAPWTLVVVTTDPDILRACDHRIELQKIGHHDHHDNHH
jgi:ABC-type bacteriocin/lantibiotic exporter with double-glycine peptidase domain